MTKVLDLIKKSRSYRRFYQETTISREELVLMVEAARFSPASRNIQPLKYILVNTPEECAKINEVMKKYRKTLFPALSISKKISYILI